MADEWYWPQALGDSGFSGGPTTTGWAPQNFCYGAAISVAKIGKASKLGIRTQSSSGSTVKIGLYDSTPSLLVQTTLTNDGTLNWKEVVIPDTDVVVGTYYVLVSSSDVNSLYSYNASFDGRAATVAYASAMPASPTLTVETNLLYAVKVFVKDALGTVDQEGFRGINDDGNEAGATFKAAQDTNFSVGINQIFRLRFLLNSVNDLGSKQWKPQYRRVGAAAWRNTDKIV